VVISLLYLVSLLFGVPLFLHLATFLMFFGLVLIKKENNIHFILKTNIYYYCIIITGDLSSMHFECKGMT